MRISDWSSDVCSSDLQRNPVTLAKEVATLDRLSGGRMELGIGVGWLEEEFDALGIPFADRGKRTDEHIEALRALWTQEKATHQGTYSSFTNAISRPPPTQPNGPITVAGPTQPPARPAGPIRAGYLPP